MKRVIMALLIVVIGCSGNSAAPAPAPVTITASQVFNASMIGQTWIFQNGFGDVSTIDIPADAFCEAGICDGKSVVMHFAKTVCRSYWQPGICGAELWFVIHVEADKSYRAIASKVKFPARLSLFTMHAFYSSNFDHSEPTAYPGMPLPYTVIPATGTEGQDATVETAYTSFWQIGALTDDAVAPNFPATQIPWSTTSGVQQINTPMTGTVKTVVLRTA